MHRFESDNKWEERGTVEVGRDTTGKAVNVKVLNNPILAANTMK